MLEKQTTIQRTATLHQQDILRHFSRNKPMAVGELASLHGISSAAATKQVNRLERKRLVKRVFDEMDRRRVLILLTPLGFRRMNEP